MYTLTLPLGQDERSSSMNSFLFHLVYFYNICNKFHVIRTKTLVLSLLIELSKTTCYIPKYSMTIRRCRASISKHTLSIEISFGSLEVFGKRSSAGHQRVLNMLYPAFRLSDLGITRWKMIWDVNDDF